MQGSGRATGGEWGDRSLPSHLNPLRERLTQSSVAYSLIDKQGCFLRAKRCFLSIK